MLLEALGKPNERWAQAEIVQNVRAKSQTQVAYARRQIGHERACFFSDFDARSAAMKGHALQCVVERRQCLADFVM
ncbi:hypothetical protein PA7_42890 [Pseudonocardia asaccharolytica DSM 44247 = NBRC 16224]|uniref:Uncharacterized protein n=1 Tax=Pseudonocardia asaccharolytica DSM 44247 = NBRC 16224 TaxID=1123024 RepID=A0A511D6Q6_9PSEU|nr:hypothetical protein [Pseudonocardia asaccharolytica]GEL20452.1 hypothetical protein PA7_42890 [Pseudonocardia asaccharolytica DSM 44247 = NBRC 16224]